MQRLLIVVKERIKQLEQDLGKVEKKVKEANNNSVPTEELKQLIEQMDMLQLKIATLSKFLSQKLEEAEKLLDDNQD